MADPKPLARDQLAKFLPDSEAIRRFERLFAVAGDLTPADVATLFRLSQEASIDAGLANTKATEASDSLQRIARSLEVMASNPQYQMPRSFPIDYIDWDENPKAVDKTRRMEWNPTDDTLDLHHTGGVTQQMGSELYARITNNSATNFPNGSAVGFDPGPDSFFLFIADGSTSPINIIGVTTQDISIGDRGRITVWGRVRNIDTTGAPFGEVWAAGDVLYVSPTVAGGFTIVKPTAPSLSMPIAQVRVLSSTAGEIFIRPTIEQQLFYGSFVKTTDQSPAAINTAYAITWDGVLLANGISIGAPSSRIVAANAGLYKFSVSFQLTSSSASVKNVWFWFRLNGVDVADSSLITSLDSGTAIRTPSRDLFFSMAAGDYIELMFAADSTAMTIDNIPSTAFAPAAPAATLTVNQEQQ